MNKRNFDVEYSTNTLKKQKNNIEINLEDVIQYGLMPSLQHVAISNIIITLWNQADIKYEIVKLYNEHKSYLYADICRLFPKIEDKVIDKVLQLPLPHRIRKILSSIVQLIGNEIIVWIEYQDQCIFNLDILFRDPNSIAINYIDYLVWTSRGRIDYQETAKTLLAKEENLLEEYKYNIACAYCFEDNIAILAPKFINTSFYSCDEMRAMAKFWTAHTAGDFTELNEAVYLYNRYYSTDYSINEYLFKLLIQQGTNQVAVKYIWNKLSNEEKSRQIVQAIKETRNTDKRCFLLSQISKEQEKEVFKLGDANVILLEFLDDWFWGHYFLHVVNHIWNIMSGWDYIMLLDSIVNKMRENHEDSEKHNHNKYIFKELWQLAPKNLKEYISGNYNNIFRGMFFKLFYKKNLDIIQLILADMNDEQKKKIIFSRNGIKKCSIYLKSDRWDLLEILIEHTLFSGEDVDCFKQALIKEKGYDIAEHLIQNKEWAKVDQFLQWALNSVDDVRKFKLKFAYCKFCNDILESMVANNKADFMELEKFFKWCASGNTERVIEFKKEIPGRYFKTVICKLIELNKYELLDQILNWCFSYNQKQIISFKKYYYQEDTIYKIGDLLVNIILKNNLLESLDKFIDYWCSSAE